MSSKRSSADKASRHCCFPCSCPGLVFCTTSNHQRMLQTVSFSTALAARQWSSSKLRVNAYERTAQACLPSPVTVVRSSLPNAGRMRFLCAEVPQIRAEVARLMGCIHQLEQLAQDVQRTDGSNAAVRCDPRRDVFRNSSGRVYVLAWLIHARRPADTCHSSAAFKHRVPQIAAPPTLCLLVHRPRLSAVGCCWSRGSSCSASYWKLSRRCRCACT